METVQKKMTSEIAEAARRFQRQMTGHSPESVTAVLGERTLVITLYGALSPAEKVLAQSAAGASQVQEFHRQLFAISSGALRQAIERIIGIDVLEAAAEVETISGAVIHSFASGTVVQVFHLARKLPAEIYGGPVHDPVATP